MKILILTEGGKNIGFGHITRCISLSQAFEEKEMSPELIVSGDEVVENLLKDKKHEVFNWLKEEERLFNLARNAAIVIVDSYLADFNFYKKISEIAEISVYIDDNKRFDYPTGFVINGSVYAEELDYPEREGIIYLLGNQYALLRKEFWDVQEKATRDKIESVMLTFGGNDSEQMTLKILRMLKETYPEMTKKVTIARGFQNVKEIESLKNSKTEFIYYPDAEMMKQVMLEVDIVISAGGQTLYELAKVGVATVAVAVTDNQLRNVEGWQRTGFVEYAGWWKDKNTLENIKVIMTRLVDRIVREKKAKIGMRIVDGKGAKRIVDYLLRYKL